MDDAAQDLRTAAALVRTVVLGLALVAHERRAALRTAVDVFERAAVRRTLRQLHARDFRYDLAPLFDIDHVAGTDVQQRHLLGVVERGAPHGGARELHRFEVGHRSHGPRASDLEIDAREARQRLFGLELVGHGPLGRLGRGAQRAAYVVAVHLDDHAVRGIGQRPALLVPQRDVFVDPGRVATDAHGVRNAETPLPGLAEVLPVGVVGQGVARHLVQHAVQTAAGHLGRGLQLERAGRGVARIGEERLARGFAFGVEPVERGVGHEDFAPDFEVVGPVVAVEPQGHRADRAHVGRHVVALRAVAPRHGAHEASVFVGERYGRAVELQLAHVFGRPDLPFDAGDEFVEFVGRVGVAQREHRESVAHAAELRRDVAAHAHRGRVGIGVFGVFALQLRQLAHQRVELEVGDFGSVLHIVFAVVAMELASELLDPFAYHSSFRYLG